MQIKVHEISEEVRCIGVCDVELGACTSRDVQDEATQAMTTKCYCGTTLTATNCRGFRETGYPNWADCTEVSPCPGTTVCGLADDIPPETWTDMCACD